MPPWMLVMLFTNSGELLVVLGCLPALWWTAVKKVNSEEKWVWNLMKMCTCSFTKCPLAGDAWHVWIPVVCPPPPHPCPPGSWEKSGPDVAAEQQVSGAVWRSLRTGLCFSKEEEMHYWKSGVLSKFCLLCIALGDGNWLVGLFVWQRSKDSSDQFKRITNSQTLWKYPSLDSSQAFTRAHSIYFFKIAWHKKALFSPF